ncbi:DUF1559 domain-containing protein [Bythopirellula goksoeyrii]|uniref:DUF1559 domain-containing protein n=1 Tax=Bythopirellula goksoeyrii TaxID=1400387 RepID=A0A5B9QBH0_9BACT|nr:DUF1559 domain-containing protein [Bythopirellula goksoeyrii]QEG36397.1 hypothetical protein Pr1d_37110 [Bythopirellula goksoeyrii]
MDRSHRSLGFTLVELLVVIAIIGVLVGLLLPAVQAAREAARRMQCVNNLKQMGLGFMNHESTHRILPCSGWTAVYVGDPLMGTGREQPGGWIYQLLPFVEQQAIYDITDDGDKLNITAAQQQQSIDLQGKAISFFNCPSRRPAQAQPYALSNSWTPRNGTRAPFVARSDYAANAGDGEEGMKFWLEDEQKYETKLEWLFFDYKTIGSKQWPPLEGQTGVNYQGAEIGFKDITDGSSNTYAVGEKYLNPAYYESDGTFDGGDNHSMYQGFDWDVNRWTSVNDPPLQDRLGQESFGSFGSAHPGGFNMANCDGSVQIVSYDIDPEVHRRASHRSDGGGLLPVQTPPTAP